MQRKFLTCTALFGLALCLPASLLARNSIDYRQMRNEIQMFENILQTALKSEFNHPLALVNEPKGSYLPGYGVNFSFLLNINRDEIITPFGIKRLSPSTRTRAEKMRLVRDMILKLLGEFGNALTQLSSEESFAVSAHLEDRTALVPSQREAVLVFRVTKKTLSDYSVRKIDFRQFRDKVEVIEY
ncbi:MAG TPA: hypothetical protein VGL91_21860 [Acidobacteriota bacterium]